MEDLNPQLEPSDPCYRFTNVDKVKQEFYSPDYPDNYPNNTDCVLILTGKLLCIIDRCYIRTFSLSLKLLFQSFAVLEEYGQLKGTIISPKNDPLRYA